MARRRKLGRRKRRGPKPGSAIIWTVDRLARLLADAHTALQARDGSWAESGERISRAGHTPKKINAAWIAKWLEESNWAEQLEDGQDDSKKGVIKNKYPSADQLRQILKRLDDPRVRNAAWKYLLGEAEN